MSNDYGKAVAKEIRDLAKDFAAKPVETTNADGSKTAGIDKAVAEQVIADRREKGDLKP